MRERSWYALQPDEPRKVWTARLAGQVKASYRSKDWKGLKQSLYAVADELDLSPRSVGLAVLTADLSRAGMDVNTVMRAFRLPPAQAETAGEAVDPAQAGPAQAGSRDSRAGRALPRRPLARPEDLIPQPSDPAQADPGDPAPAPAAPAQADPAQERADPGAKLAREGVGMADPDPEDSLDPDGVPLNPNIPNPQTEEANTSLNSLTTRDILMTTLPSLARRVPLLARVLPFPISGPLTLGLGVHAVANRYIFAPGREDVPPHEARKAFDELLWAGKAIKPTGALDKAPELLDHYLGGSGKAIYVDLAEAKQRMKPFLAIDKGVLNDITGRMLDPAASPALPLKLSPSSGSDGGLSRQWPRPKKLYVSSPLGQAFKGLPADGQAHDLDPALLGMPKGRFPVSKKQNEKERKAEQTQIEALRTYETMQHFWSGDLDTAIGTGRTVADGFIEKLQAVKQGDQVMVTISTVILLDDRYDFNKGKAYSRAAAKIEEEGLAAQFDIKVQPYRRQMTLGFKRAGDQYQLVKQETGPRQAAGWELYDQ